MSNVEVIPILNGQTAGQIRANINTNFNNLLGLIDNIPTNNNKTYVTSEWTELEDVLAGDVQIAVSSNSITVGVYGESGWIQVGQMETSNSGVIIEQLGQGIGYSVSESMIDDDLEGKLVGFDSTGSLVEADNTTPIPTKGLYVGGKIYTQTKIANSLSDTVAGQMLYLSTSGGLTVTPPSVAETIVQCVGFVADNNLSLNINISSDFAEVVEES
jgi:hypothetical protein